MRGGFIIKKMEMARRFILLLHALLVIFFGPLAYAQFGEMNALVQAGQYTEAVNKLEALAESAEDTNVKSLYYYQLGDIHYNYTHQYNRALAAYDNILKLAKKGLAAEDLYLAIIQSSDTGVVG